jgi:hypothetical protein
MEVHGINLITNRTLKFSILHYTQVMKVPDFSTNNDIYSRAPASEDSIAS